MAWPKPSGTIECLLSPMGRSGPRVTKPNQDRDEIEILHLFLLYEMSLVTITIFCKSMCR